MVRDRGGGEGAHMDIFELEKVVTEFFALSLCTLPDYVPTPKFFELFCVNSTTGSGQNEGGGLRRGIL